MTIRPMLVGPLVHLRTLAPFRSLSPAQLSILALEADEMVYEPGSWLVTEGAPVRALHMIIDGYAKRVGLEGGATLGPWSLIGFPDLLVPDPAAAGVRADTDVVALRLETDTLRDVCERNFAILDAILTFLADRVADSGAANRSTIAGAPDVVRPLPRGEVDRVAKMIALHRAPAFPLVSMDALAELAERVEATELRRGEALWDPGSTAEGFWVVASGSVTLRVGRGPELVAGVGAIPGFPETLAGRRYGYVAEAAEDSTLLWVSVDPFMDVLEDHFELGYALLGWLARHLLATGSG